MYKVVDYYRNNPNAKPMEAVSYFEEEFGISEQVRVLKIEAVEAHAIRKQLRPIFGERLVVEENMKYALSDMELEVYMEYPPRQGTDAQRESMRNRLKKENVEYRELQTQFRALTDRINDIEDDYKELESKAKNARRLTELFQEYVAFINTFAKG